MIKNYFISLLILAILQCSMSQSVTCPDGTFPTTPLPDSEHGQCTRCHFTCKTCTAYAMFSPPSCTSYKDYIKGYELDAPGSKKEGQFKSFLRNRLVRNGVSLVSF